jgi:hypothetical protein
MRRLAPACLLAALALPAAAPAQEFRCPPAGLVALLSDGHTLRQDGADPADPLVCLRRSERPGEADKAERLLANALPEGEPAERAARRAALASLLPWRAGAEAQLTLPNADGPPVTVAFKVVSIAPRRLPAGEFTVVSLQETRRNGVATIVSLHGLDAATGAYLSFWGEFQMGGMFTRAIPSEAVRVTPATGR